MRDLPTRGVVPQDGLPVADPLQDIQSLRGAHPRDEALHGGLQAGDHQADDHLPYDLLLKDPCHQDVPQADILRKEPPQVEHLLDVLLQTATSPRPLTEVALAEQDQDIPIPVHLASLLQEAAPQQGTMILIHKVP